MKYIYKSLLRIVLMMLILSLLPTAFYGQQIEIPRISTMPDFPEPYLMRDWQAVAQGYDSLIFDQQLTGQYLPVVFFRDQSHNYPAYPSFGLHTAIGTVYPASGEGINAIPAVVGATLAGIDKSQQFGENWALMIQEFFNNRPEENIYLNHPVTASGHDWWYESMPNIFFMQLKYLYPDIEVFGQQLPVMADQWELAVRAMGASDTPWQVPYMNYRAWNMSEMTPLDSGVKQPEAAGALAWIFYNTYVETGNRKHLKAAEWAMEFLNQWEENPSYELQLPYGIYTAARMNAEVGTDYDIEKMVNWAFDRGHLRGWGAISGNWGGYDCHGLIGEANDNGNDYAFMMNGYQQAAALVPMLRYDYRFAHAIAKWVLNMANASRLFYPNYLPENMQDNSEWAQTYDPSSYIGYEALREVKHGYSPYATGDAMEGGWAQTNLMLYGSSHVGYLAGIIQSTNIEGILQLDLLKTDFYKQDALPTYLYYNPFETANNVYLDLPAGEYKIYDVISKQLLFENQSESLHIPVPAKEAVMPVIIPQAATITVQGNKTFADGVVIDFNNGLDTGALPPRIKALAATNTIMLTEGNTEVFCTATNPGGTELEYLWFFPDGSFTGEEQTVFYAPPEPGFYNIACKVMNTDGLSDSLDIMIEVVEKMPYPPDIHWMRDSPRKLKPEEQSAVQIYATDFYDEPLEYEWEADNGLISGNGTEVSYTAPAEPGNYYIRCQVSNPDGLMASDSIQVMVRNYDDNPDGETVAFYPLRGNTFDYSGNELHATSGGGLGYTNDMGGTSGYAAYFNGASAYVLMPDSELFNFNEQLGIAAFLKTDEQTANEQHPISHGSWEHRYKISISNQQIRFTLNTGDGIKDLDSESSVNAGEWFHLAAVYDGRDMEIWLNGELDAFIDHTGQINQSPYRPVLGQNIPGNNNYNFKGAMAMVNVFNHTLTPAMISDSLSLNNPYLHHTQIDDVIVYPNPLTSGQLYARLETAGMQKAGYSVFNMYGQLIIAESDIVPSENNVFTIRLSNDLPDGVYFLRLLADNNIYVQTFVVRRK